MLDVVGRLRTWSFCIVVGRLMKRWKIGEVTADFAGIYCKEELTLIGGNMTGTKK